MKLGEFVNTYIGKKVDYDKQNGYQCVDLYRKYCNDVLGIPQTPATGDAGAKALFSLHGKNLVAIENSKATYLPGDILVWGATPTNKYGHVAIVVQVFDNNKFVVIEQDGYSQKGTVFALRSNKNLLGCLRLPATNESMNTR